MTSEQQHTLRVLVALDGSPAAATALPVARTIGEQLGASTAALHVVDAVDGEATRQSDHLLLGAPDAALCERRGEAARAILEAAAEPDVALVVLTTHGRDIEPGRSLGRVAEAVIASVVRPIVLVRPEATASSQTESAPLQHLLVPLDGTPSTADSLRPVTALAERLGASLDLLLVVDSARAGPAETGTVSSPRYVDQAHHEWPQWASEAIARLARYCAHCPAGVPVRMFLTTGDVGGEVVRFATENTEDAIVLVRRSKLEPGRAAILRAILDRTPCPIVLVGRDGAG